MSTEKLIEDVATLKAALVAQRDRESLLIKVAALLSAVLLGVLGYTNFSVIPDQAKLKATEAVDKYLSTREAGKQIDKLESNNQLADALIMKLKSLIAIPAWEPLVGSERYDEKTNSPQFRVIAPDMVQLRGAAPFSGKLINVGFLPVGARPAKRVRYNVRCGGGTCTVSINDNGAISLGRENGNIKTWASLDGVEFSTAADISATPPPPPPSPPPVPDSDGD